MKKRRKDRKREQSLAPAEFRVELNFSPFKLDVYNGYEPIWNGFEIKGEKSERDTHLRRLTHSFGTATHGLCTI